MNYICSWFCADKKGEESFFPQTGKLSSSEEHQNIYWRCAMVFFISSKRFNKNEKHVFFTNVSKLPVIDGKDVGEFMKELGVDVVHTDFKYKTPKGYFGSFQNQFYEFSILEYIALNNHNPKDHYLILDSDCIFIKPAADLFSAAAVNGGFMSFEDGCNPDQVTNGLSRRDLKVLYEELLQRSIDEVPLYMIGEFLLCSVQNIKKIYADFLPLWPWMLERYASGKKKFNEEAHTLSFLYYKNGLKHGQKDTYIRRIWTNPLFYRNVEPTDVNLIIWHLPAEKTFSLRKLYDLFVIVSKNYGFDMSNEAYINLVRKVTCIPLLPLADRLTYYAVGNFRALEKRAKKLQLLLQGN